MQQGMADQEVTLIECRLRRTGGKLVEGYARITRDCRVLELRLEGEFFADPELDEKMEEVRGLDAEETLKRLEEILQETHAEPYDDILSCAKRLLLCG